MPSGYVVGHTVKLYVEFTSAGTLADPTTVTIKIKEPDGTLTTYVYNTDSQVVRESTGKYYVLWTTAKIGRHSWDALGSGTQAAIEDKVFHVRASRTA